MSSRNNDRILYVGNLPGDIREREVEDLFYKYGRIVVINLKIPARPPCYAFIEFEDAGDAEDAIRGRNGYNFDGNRLQVELAHGRRGSSSYDYHCDSSGGAHRGVGVLRHTSYRVKVTGLPSSVSWQDLKEYMLQAGDVCLSEVYHDGEATTGIVDFTNYTDMKCAIKRFDGSEFKNASSQGYIRMEEYDPKRSSSSSHSRCYSRSPSRCHERSLSRSKSPKPESHLRSSSPCSHSASEVRSMSRSRSRSRSPTNKNGKDAMNKAPKEAMSPARSTSHHGESQSVGSQII